MFVVLNLTPVIFIINFEVVKALMLHYNTSLQCGVCGGGSKAKMGNGSKRGFQASKNKCNAALN